MNSSIFIPQTDLILVVMFPPFLSLQLSVMQVKYKQNRNLFQMTYQRLSVSKRRLKLNLDDLALILNKTNDFCPADGWSRQEGQTNQTNVASKQKSCQGLRIKTACACYQRPLISINAFCWTLCILNSSSFFWHIILHMLVSSS